MTVSDPLTDGARPPVEPDAEPLTGSVTQTDADRQDAPGEWLDSRAAMLRLGISERTLHRRVGRGELRKRHRADGRLEVWVPVEERRAVSDSATDVDRQAEQAERAIALVERVNLAVSQQVAPLLDLVKQQQDTIREQAEELGRLRQQATEHERRQDAAVTTPDTMTDADRQGVREPTARPWWRFW